MPLEPEQELQTLKDTLDELARSFDDLDDEIDADVVADILRGVVAGHTAEAILASNNLERDEEDEEVAKD